MSSCSDSLIHFFLSSLVVLPLLLLLLATLFLCILCFFLPSSFSCIFGGCGPIPQKGWSLFLTPCFPAFFGVLTKCGHYFERIRRGIWSRLVALCLLLFLLAGAKNTRNIVVWGDNNGSKVKRVNGDVAFWAKKGQKTLQK